MRLCRATSPDDIATCSVSCTLSLLRQGLNECLTQKGFDVAHAVERDLSENISGLVSWLYTLEPGADVDFYRDLIESATLERRMIGLCDDAAEYDLLRDLFLSRKVEIWLAHDLVRIYL